jgi:hypothetical protein
MHQKERPEFSAKDETHFQEQQLQDGGLNKPEVSFLRDILKVQTGLNKPEVPPPRMPRTRRARQVDSRFGFDQIPEPSDRIPDEAPDFKVSPDTFEGILEPEDWSADPPGFEAFPLVNELIDGRLAAEEDEDFEIVSTEELDPSPETLDSLDRSDDD